MGNVQVVGDDVVPVSNASPAKLGELRSSLFFHGFQDPRSILILFYVVRSKEQTKR